MADAGADLGVVRVRIEGKDMGLSKIMSNLANVTAKSAQEIQKLGDTTVTFSSQQSSAQNKTLALIQAIIRQRNAADQMQDGMEYVTSKMREFTDQSIQSARASATFQEQLRKTVDEQIKYLTTVAQSAVGTDRFEQAINDLAAAIARLDSQTSRQTQAAQKMRDLAAKNEKVHRDNARALRNAATEELRLVQAQARASAASKDHAAAIYSLQTALNGLRAKYGQVITQTTQYASAQAQLARYQRQTDADSRRLNGSLFAAVKGLNSYVGAFYALRAVFANIGVFFQFGNELEKTIATVRALSKTQVRFNEVMRAAKKEQSLFGGSLQQTLTDFTGFIYLSNQTGLSIQRLIDVARRLSVIDPAQGMSGASVALKEFFSGDIQSLSRRFEIDRNTLNSVKGLGTALERLEGLDKVLADMGISQDIIAQRAQLTAIEYDKLGGYALDFWTQLSRIAAISFKDQAISIGNTLKNASEYLENQTNAREFDLDMIVNEYLKLEEAAIQSNSTWEEFKNTIKNVSNEAVLEYGQRIHYLTEAQLLAAQALVASGDSAKEAASKVRGYTGNIEGLNSAISNNLLNTTGAFSSSIEVSDRMLNDLNTTIDQTVALFINVGNEFPHLVPLIEQYVAAINDGRVTTNEAYSAVLRALDGERQKAQAMQTGAAITQTATEKIKEYNKATKDSIEENIEAKIQSDLLGASQELLAAYAQAAAEGLIDAKTAAILMGNEFDLAKDKAYLLVEGLRQIRQQSAKAQLISSMGDLNITPQAINAWEASGIDLTIVYDQLTEMQEERRRKLEEEARGLAAAKDAQEAYKFSQLDTAAQIEYLKTKLKGYTQTQKEYWDTLGDIADLEERLRREKEGGRGGGATPSDSELKAAQNLYYELKDIQYDFYKDSEQAERDHQQKMLDIYNEFAKKQKAAERINETDKRKSRASFYESLMGIEGIDTQTFSAQYEAAFAEAQRIAQEGKATLSKEFLSLRQDQIDQMIQLEQELADVRGDDKLTESEKQSRIEYIKGIMRLYEDAHQEELKQLMESGDENANQLQEQLKAEQQAYADQTQEIAKKASEQADAKVTAAERSKKAIVSENDLLREQYLLIKNITDLKTEGAVAVAPIVTPPTSIPSAMPDTVPMTAIAPPQGVNYVHDQVVNNTLIVLGSRLEGKLTELTARMEAGLDILGGHLLSIDRGISRLPTTSLTSR